MKKILKTFLIFFASISISSAQAADATCALVGKTSLVAGVAVHANIGKESYIKSQMELFNTNDPKVSKASKRELAESFGFTYEEAEKWLRVGRGKYTTERLIGFFSGFQLGSCVGGRDGIYRKQERCTADLLDALGKSRKLDDRFTAELKACGN